MARRKRANAEGSIYYRESRDRWEAVLTVGRDERGRPVRRTFTGKTRKAVTAKLDAAKSALEHGLDVPDNRATVATFAAWWLAEVMPGEGLAPKTEIFYDETLRLYVLPLVGHRTLTGPKALTPADVETMTSSLGKRGLSTRVQTAARTTLGKVLRAAEVRGLVGRNVARLARPPRNRGKARPVKALTPAEVGALLDAVEGSRWSPVAVVGATTGLRPGELLALHWADVRLDGEPQVSVRLSLSHAAGEPVLKAPKRPRSYRTVPLPPEAVEALKAWRKQQAAEQLVAGELWSPDWPGLVFTTEDGRPRRVDVYRQTLQRAVPGVHPHRLRHTYTTHLLEAGVPIHHVAELIGDTVATVESTYSHVMRPKHEVAAVASAVIGGGDVMTLVAIRCPSCRRVLAQVDSVPTDWTGSIDVPPCERHTPDALSRIGPRRMRRMEQQISKHGRYEVVVAHRVRLEDLRPAIERALASGRTVDETI